MVKNLTSHPFTMIKGILHKKNVLPPLSITVQQNKSTNIL